MEYGLCRQTVTLYRKTEAGISRQVVENCCYTWQDIRRDSSPGTRLERKFRLIMPGSPQRVLPGDRVFPGVGPELTLGQWTAFLPVTVPGLSQVRQVKPCFLGECLLHTEAS